MKVYKLCRDAKSVVPPAGLKYFQTHFVGKAMAKAWRPPSEIEISNKSKTPKDFVSWMLSAPVVSERAKTNLEPLIGDRAEFLPLLKVKGKMETFRAWMGGAVLDW